MKRLHFGCGSNHLDGWINTDAEVDVTKRLPHDNDSADVIFAAHLVEHLTIHHAWLFLDECYRILKPNGVIRIAVPSVVRIESFSTPEYEKFLFDKGFSHSKDKKGAVEAIIFQHGHKSAWDGRVLEAFIRGVGFQQVDTMNVYSSRHGLENVDGHGKVIGDEFNELETVVVEGVK